MRSVNKVIIIGNLTRDPEMRETPNGQNVTTFGIATNRQWSTNEGEKKSSAEFHECVAWARLAEICNQYLKKGALIYIEGYLKTRSWEAEDGTKKFKTEIVMQDMIMLEKRSDAKEEDFDSEITPAEPTPEIDESNETPNAEKEEEPGEEEPPAEKKAEEREQSESALPTDKAKSPKNGKTEKIDIDKDLGL